MDQCTHREGNMFSILAIRGNASEMDGLQRHRQRVIMNMYLLRQVILLSEDKFGEDESEEDSC